MLMVIVYGGFCRFFTNHSRLLLEKDEGGVRRINVCVCEAVLCVLGKRNDQLPLWFALVSFSDVGARLYVPMFNASCICLKIICSMASLSLNKRRLCFCLAFVLVLILVALFPLF